MHKLNFGQFSEKSMEWVALKEPCYYYWIVRNGVHDAQFFDTAYDHFALLTKRLHALKLKTSCQTCQTAMAEGMVITQDDKNRVSSVFFHCTTCAKAEGLRLFRPSLLAWPMNHDKDRFGSQKVRTALLAACGAPMLEASTQKEMEAFFSDPENFTLEVPVVEDQAA